MNKIRASVILWAALTRVAGADDVQSVDSAALGRVFTSPAERAELDRLRQVRPAEATAAAVTSDAAAATTDSQASPVGFIKRTGGEAYRWVGDEFRKVGPDELPAVEPAADPGIVRHAEPDNGTGSGDAHTAESNDDAAN